jgi:hypothetical protein
VTAAEKKLVEETRRQLRDVLKPLEHACRLARIAVDGNEPEHAVEYLFDTLADLKPKFPALRRAFQASRVIP